MGDVAALTFLPPRSTLLRRQREFDACCVTGLIVPSRACQATAKRVMSATGSGALIRHARHLFCLTRVAPVGSALVESGVFPPAMSMKPEPWPRLGNLPASPR